MAEITVKCSNCGAELIADEQDIGKEASCQNCEATFIVKGVETLETAKPSLGGFKLKLNTEAINHASSSSSVEEDEEFVAIDDEEDDEIVVIDDEEGDEEFVAIDDDEDDDDEFIAIDLSDDEDNLPEPDPGFAVLIKGINNRFWKIVIGICVVVTLAFGVICSIDRTATEFFIGAGIGLIVSIIFLFIVFVIHKIFCGGGDRRVWKRDLVKEYFLADEMLSAGLNLFDKLMEFFEEVPLVAFIPALVKGIAKNKRDEYCRVREPYYDEVQDLDLEYLNKLNVLARFGKDKTQLVAPMQTLFAPAFGGVEGVKHFASIVSEDDALYRYNLEEVTKIYTFEDQIFIYTGVWAYSIGKMISETTEAFFFKDITDIRTESIFKIHEIHIPKGCLSIIIPACGKSIEKVYKESERFVLTSSSGHSIGLTIGFEEAISVTGATYTKRNDNERVIHAIRKMIEEKKVMKND